MRFVPAGHFTDTGPGGRRVDLIVQHLMVAPETSDRAEACAEMFRTTTRDASAHYCVDNNSAVQCVRDEDVAWAAPGANHDGIQIEQAGTLQSIRQWHDQYTTAMLAINADLCAQLSREHSVPVRWLDARDLLANQRGFTDHWEATKAFKLSTHTDCGETYRQVVPEFLEEVRAIARRLGHDPDSGPAEKPELAVVQLGDSGWVVKKAQRRLVVAGFLHRDEVDGTFGPRTRAAVVQFDQDRGLPRDGVVDARTWKALRAA